MPAHALVPLLLIAAVPTGPAAGGDGSGFGKSLALVGDLDADKCSEIAVGSPSDGEGRRGKVFLFSGKTGKLLRELAGDTTDGAFGSDVAGVGDQDGDGIPDFAVGAPLVRVEGAEGRVVVYSGKDGRPLRTLSALADEHAFGSDLVSIGDLNGDKKEELLVRARAGTGPAEHERFVVFTLATGKRMFAVDSPSGATSHDLGRPIARLPDLDGDKLPDFAVEFGSDVHLCSGKDGKIFRTLSSPIPPTEKSRFGFSMCGFADKVPVVVVGDVEQDLHGSVRLFRIDALEDAGAAEKEGSGAVLVGEEGFSGVGRSVAFAGDVDGDGVPDLAMGWTDGHVGGVLVLSSKDLNPVRALDEEAEKKPLPLGWRVSAGLDVDGDGTPDVAASRYWPTAPAAVARGVVLVSGATGRALYELTTPAAPPAKDGAGKKPPGK